MKKYFLMGLLGVVGCQCLEKLVGPQLERNDAYNSAPQPIHIPRIEPYAILAGRHFNEDGTYEKFYIVHWKGTELDNQSVLESEIDALEIPKYDEEKV